MVNTPVFILHSSKPLLSVLPVLKVANIQSHSVTDLHSTQLQTNLSQSQTHLCWKWPTYKVLSRSVTDLHSAQLRTRLSVSDSPVLKVANMQICLELFSYTDRLTFSTAPNPSLSVSDSPQVANMQMSRAVQWQTYILHSSEPFFLSQTHLSWKWPRCKCLESLCERHSPQLKTLLSLSVWDSPVLKMANMQMS